MDISLFSLIATFVGCSLFSYLLGSCSFAVIVVRVLYKKDIRDYGSNNAGMTNVLRTFGKKAAALTLVGDVLKGTVAVLLTRLVFTLLLPGISPIYGAYVAALCAILGHIYPIYFNFKGGKAVSVSIGAILSINPIVAPFLVVMFFILFFTSKMVSVGSIGCAIGYPIATLAYCIYADTEIVFPTFGAVVICCLVIYLHRSNIKRILNGTEYKFMQKKDKQ